LAAVIITANTIQGKQKLLKMLSDMVHKNLKFRW
jgi:hypothetical protein